MSERRGVWSLLYNPTIYEAFHHLIGARRWLRRFTRDVIRAGASDRVLDVGCGPGALLHYLPATTAYVGFDRNRAYIERARRLHQGRGEFVCDDLANFASHALPRVDVAVAIGVLHHLDDGLASDLLGSIAATLNPGGRLITVDPCFHRDQSPLQRFFVSQDRGMHVRPFEQYVALCGTVFPGPKAALKQGYVPFPHSVCIMQAAKQAELGSPGRKSMILRDDHV
jgi:SAM-dependent methyltransferase